MKNRCVLFLDLMTKQGEAVKNYSENDVLHEHDLMNRCFPSFLLVGDG